MITALIVLACVGGMAATTFLQPDDPGKGEKTEAAEELNRGAKTDLSAGNEADSGQQAEEGQEDEDGQQTKEGQAAGDRQKARDTKKQTAAEGEKGKAQKGGTSSAQAAAGVSGDKNAQNNAGTDDKKNTQNSGNEKPTTNPSQGQEGNGQEKQEFYCSIEIRCDSISGNGLLTANQHPEKEEWAADPVILSVTKVKVKKGMTVYDVLYQACRQNGIHIESSYTPGYGSYYIEGINHLYQFDAGEGSGWTYRVNQRYPNVGCSAYVLSEGDTIVWEYVV